MSEREVRLDAARLNAAFARHLEQQGAPFDVWAPTAIFYVGVQLVDVRLLEANQPLPGDHGDRRKAIKRMWGDKAAGHYVNLKSASQSWRYYGERPTVVDITGAWNVLDALAFEIDAEVPEPDT